MNHKVYRVLALFAAAACVYPFISCSGDAVPPGDDPQPGSFDGQWAWVEDGEILYNVTIENNKVASWEFAGPNAKRRSSEWTCSDYCRRDGPLALSTFREITRDGVAWIEDITLRFDLDDNSTSESRWEAMDDGVLPGRRYVELVDKQDIFMQPPLEVADGELIRMTSK